MDANSSLKAGQCRAVAQVRPHLVASVPQVLQGQTLSICVEESDQGLGRDKKGEMSDCGVCWGQCTRTGGALSLRSTRVLGARGRATCHTRGISKAPRSLGECWCLRPDTALTGSTGATDPGGLAGSNALVGASRKSCPDLASQCTLPGAAGPRGGATASPHTHTCPRSPAEGGTSTRSYLQGEVEAAVEVGRDVKVGAQRLQNGLQKQLPEGLQHPAGTQHP